MKIRISFKAEYKRDRIQNSQLKVEKNLALLPSQLALLLLHPFKMVKAV